MTWMQFMRWLKSTRGVVAVEFAMMLPFLCLLLVGTYEFGSFLYDGTVLKKSVRAGAMLAGRYGDISTDETTAISNLIKYGTTTPGAGDKLLIEGWSDAAASITITETDVTTSHDGTDVDIVVYTITVRVPYIPFMDGFMRRFGTLMLEASHDQRRIGGF